MQHIAIITLAAATSGTALLLGWLWVMESRGRVPAWVRRMHDAGSQGSGDLLH
jgi:hypothetical protein